MPLRGFPKGLSRTFKVVARFECDDFSIFGLFPEFREGLRSAGPLKSKGQGSLPTHFTNSNHQWGGELSCAGRPSAVSGQCRRCQRPLASLGARAILSRPRPALAPAPLPCPKFPKNPLSA